MPSHGAMTNPTCPWCEETHDPERVCGAVRSMLDAMLARSDGRRIPTQTFDEPVPLEQLDALGLGPGDVLLMQTKVMAGTAEVAGVPRPVLVFGGLDHAGKQLPRWVYLTTDEDMIAYRDLVVRMCDLAIQRAKQDRLAKAGLNVIRSGGDGGLAGLRAKASE